jgi:hypothetical protein
MGRQRMVLQGRGPQAAPAAQILGRLYFALFPARDSNKGQFSGNVGAMDSGSAGGSILFLRVFLTTPATVFTPAASAASLSIRGLQRASWA